MAEIFFKFFLVVQVFPCRSSFSMSSCEDHMRILIVRSTFANSLATSDRCSDIFDFLMTTNRLNSFSLLQLLLCISELFVCFCCTQLRWMDPIEPRMLYFKSEQAIASQVSSQFLLSEFLISKLFNRDAIGTYQLY